LNCQSGIYKKGVRQLVNPHRKLREIAFVSQLLFLCTLLLFPQSVFSAAPELSFGLRTRLETAQVAEQHAHALTIKARISVTQNFLERFNTFLQLDNVVSLDDDKHSNGVNQSAYPTIADPKGTEINQATIQTDWLDTSITLGRQRIVFGDQRFIGDLGFRQNDQTYDALRLDKNLLSGSKLTLAYLHNVNRIFGDQAKSALSKTDTRFASLKGIRPKGLLGNHHIDGLLLRFNVNEWDHFDLASYGYAVHNYHAPTFSNRTFGIEGQYRQKFGHFKTKTALDLALQKQQSIQSDWIAYRKLSASIGYKMFQLGLRHEVLSEKNNAAFITPLATLHKFQGWTDQFINTPSLGLIDNSISVVFNARPWTIDIRHHLFTTDKGHIDIGKEVDIDLIFKPVRQHEVKLRIANFNPASDQIIKTNDVRKFFLMYSYNI